MRVSASISRKPALTAIPISPRTPSGSATEEPSALVGTPAGGGAVKLAGGPSLVGVPPGEVTAVVAVTRPTDVLTLVFKGMPRAVILSPFSIAALDCDMVPN